MIGGRVLDHTALITMVSGTSEYTDALLAVANELGIPLAVPATALQAAWQAAAPGDRAWLELLPRASMTVLLELDADTARAAGLLAATAGAVDAPPAAAHAAVIALQRGWPVVTTAPDVLLALSPDVRTETIP